MGYQQFQSVFTCLKLTIETLEQGAKHVKDTSVDKDSSLFIVNFGLEHILVSLLLTLDMQLLARII